MTQSTSLGSVANVTRTEFRAIVNTCFQAVASLNSGASAPTTTYPGMHWWDTQSSTLKIRNGADNGWITIADFDGISFSPRVSQVALNAISTKKHVFDATAAPTASSDSSAGYSAGCIVLATVSGATNAYICLSATPGAAIWRQISPDVFATSVAGLVPAPTAGDVSSGYVLSAAGTWVTNGRGRTPVASQSVSGSYVEVSAIPAGTTEVSIIVAGVSLAAAQEMYLQFGTVSGIETSGYSGLVRSDSGFNAAFSTYHQLTRGLAASEAYWGRIVLFHQGSNVWTSHSVMQGVGSENHGSIATGVKTLASALTRVRIYAGASSTFDAGAIYPSYWV